MINIPMKISKYILNQPELLKQLMVPKLKSAKMKKANRVNTFRTLTYFFARSISKYLKRVKQRVPRHRYLTVRS